MPREPIRESITIHAPIERCWALSTRVELVQKTLGMTPVGGVTHGFVTAGARVVWSGWKFGLPTKHHTRITGFEPPHDRSWERGSDKTARAAFFQDSQESGRFAEFHHDHFLCQTELESSGPLTELTDEVFFRLPFGSLGELVARRIITPFIRKLMQRRFRMLKDLAEGEGWREWVSS